MGAKSKQKVRLHTKNHPLHWSIHPPLTLFYLEFTSPKYTKNKPDQEPMFAKLSSFPLKWKVLLGTQGVVTTFLIARRMDPETFDKTMFEKRVLEIKRDSEGSIKVVPDSTKKE